MAEATSIQRRQQAARKKPPRSSVWEHFDRFTDGDGKDKARCKRCGVVLGADTKNGTSSLRTHVRICKGGDGAPGNSHPAVSLPQQLPCAPPRHAEPSEREPAGLEEEGGSADLARMIALHGYDPSVVDDDYFRRFVRHLSPEFELPSRAAVEEMCDAIFDETREDLLSRISNAPGRVSLAVGNVRTVEGEALYTACHFIDDEWNLHRVIVDAYVVLPFEGGAVLGVEDVNFCQDLPWSIDEVFTDLSSRNVLPNPFFMVWETKLHGADSLELTNQIKRRLTDEQACNQQTQVTFTYMDNVIHAIARLLSVSLDFDFDFDFETSYAFKCLNLTRQKRKQILSQLGLDNNLWAYGEKWYLTYHSLEVLHQKDGWSEMDELLCKLYGEMYHAIQRISTSSCPTSNLCLVELFKIREVFQSQLALASGDNADAYKSYYAFQHRDADKDVTDVIREAMDRLDGSIKDSYLLWSIPLILDPRYKLTYIEFIFKRAFADSEAACHISEVTRQIKEMYAVYIEDDETNSIDSDLVTATPAGSGADPLAEAWAEHCSSLAGRGRTTDVDSHLNAQNELDRYLEEGPIRATESFDILSWWKSNNRNYPTVARMARDALAMPTCSKLSSEQLAHVRSIFRGYSKAAFGTTP